ncbi:MAG: polymerase III, subunit gamma and tau protein [Candidatus Uhrbacteria bacterium GW2011_GWC2_53_7]|uniref:DNA polymerase III subunit gamma/tau n=1 Tax=Candidatus Uhrbacteria bacterium GW2011_GWC2_53_7 TaxID=1618986 RepID=A0A0G1XTH3_9BACT|nr:MAG: polymerase III, subunit gamma and tau protein [Candidatus Uhrbacteria bacterium GW2011_GWC2_53_7]
METLYRKHRPQTFADLIGQEHVRTTLQNQLKGGCLGHAYLFTGPRGVGKTTTARLLAKAVNCLNRKGGSEPCNACEACLEILGGRSLDVVEMDAASHTGVENVRENIIENVRFAPVLRAFKVFIIDEVHMLSASAFNALLKTLEEPPAHALFILATTEIHKVPDTIVSRTQRFDFRRIGTRELVARLERLVKAEGVTVEETVLEEIARHSEGSQRDAESLLAQVLSLGEKKITMEVASLVLPISPYEEIVSLAELLSKRDVASALVAVDRLIETGTDLDRFVYDMIRYARELLLTRLGGSPGALSDLPESVRDRSVSLAQVFEPRDLTRLMDLLLEASSSRVSIPQLPLEIAIVKFCTEAGSEFPARGGQASPIAPSDPEPRLLHGEISESPLAANSELELVSKDELAEVVMNAEVALPEEADGHVTFKTVEGKWDEVFEKVAQAHTSLGFLLKTARLIGVEGNAVRLGFDFQFHADTMNATKNRDKLEAVMQKVFGSRVKIFGEYVHADADEIVGNVVGELGALS